MIPKIAHFHWSQNGPEMSWLRWAGIRSFRKLNPDWEVRINPTPQHISGLGLLLAQEADWTAYETLAKHGGFAVSSDIVFLEPIPDWWLDCDINVCRRGGGAIYQFAMGGSVPGVEFWNVCSERCARLVSEHDITRSYQRIGTELLLEIASHMTGSLVIDQPMEAFCAVECTDIASLWADGEMTPHPNAIGVHWYGGGVPSKGLEHVAAHDSGYCITNLAVKAAGR